MKKNTVLVCLLLFVSSVLSAQDHVTFYADCNYGGNSTTLYAGRHSLLGTYVEPGKTSSIRIPYGFRVVVYDSNDPGAGNKTSFDQDVDCISSDWNDRIRSVVVEHSAARSQNVQSGDYPLTIYSECDFNGSGQGLSAGYHDMNQLGIGANRLSSLKLAPGYAVTLYDEQGFRGRQDNWSNTVNCLGDFRNKTMSLYVYRVSNHYQDNYQSNNKQNSGDYPLTIYTDCDYNGQSQNLSAGYHDAYQLGIGGKKLSSLKLSPGYAVTLYDKQAYSGATDSWKNSVACLGDFNDRTMSLYVYRVKTDTYSNNSNASNNSGYNNNYGDGVAFFSDCNFSGRSTTLHEGAFSQRQMGIADNSISSIKIPKGYSVLVFINDNFGGSMKSFTADVNCLEYDWNDKISSVQISHNSY